MGAPHVGRGNVPTQDHVQTSLSALPRRVRSVSRRFCSNCISRALSKKKKNKKKSLIALINPERNSCLSACGESGGWGGLEEDTAHGFGPHDKNPNLEPTNSIPFITGRSIKMLIEGGNPYSPVALYGNARTFLACVDARCTRAHPYAHAWLQAPAALLLCIRDAHRCAQAHG